MNAIGSPEVWEGWDAWGSRPAPPEDVCGCVPFRRARSSRVGPLTIALTSSQGGAGTTTVAALLALMGRTMVSTHLTTDRPDEVCAVLGVGPPSEGDPAMPGLTVGAVPDVRSELVIKEGPSSGDALRLMVLRGPCYLALRRLARSVPAAADGIILLAEPGRALTERDVADVTGLPVVASVGVSASVARAIDAGTVSTRLNSPEFRVLRRWLSDHFDPFPNGITCNTTDAPNRPEMTGTDLQRALSAHAAAARALRCRIVRAAGS